MTRFADWCEEVVVGCSAPHCHTMLTADASKFDAAVAIVFFNRDDTLKEVFKRISQARPSELFLIQDGPRENNENDKADIEKCRAVCE